MKHILKIAAGILLTLLGFSCSDFLDKAPEEDITIQEAFLQRNYAEGFLTDAYADLPMEIHFTDMADINPFVLASDEFNVPWPEKFGKLMNRGAWNAYNATGRVWINMYEGIRKSNIFLDNIHITPLSDEFTAQDKDRWIGEAILLRALYHFYVMRVYGPSPIMDYAATVADDFTQIRRQPLDSCINFVLRECDRAIPLLPMRAVNNRQTGRMTAAVAYALKARLLLYRASDLWNGNPDYANFKDNAGVELFPQVKDERWWAEAAAAAKKCIEECEAAGYTLYRVAEDDPVQNYYHLFLDRYNNEVILGRNCGVEPVPEKCGFPRSQGGWAGWNVTQQQVDAYEMDNGIIPITGYTSDGSPIIDSRSGYKETGYAEEAGPAGRWPAGVRNMYVHRDPRFYATVAYNGAMFKERQIELWSSGADGRGNEGRDYCTTGYLLKKYVDETCNIPQGIFSLKTWILFRLGEIYLDYAEALNEAEGPVSDVYYYVNQIRDRAGMPGLPSGLSKSEMRERIRHERRIELAFETHRYFDCHRWKIAEKTDNGPIWGMNISAGASLQDEAYYKRTLIENRVFKAPTHYLFPIFQDEIDKNPNLVQNPGW